MTTVTRGLDGIAVGDVLPELRIRLTRTLIVAGALATRDFEDVHHDPGRAMERGTPDTYMSINNTNNFVGRYVTDWTGPGAVMTKLSTRLLVPNFPGDTMTMTGEVVAVEADTITVSVRGTNSNGAHVVSQMTLRLPATTGERGASR